MKKNVILIVVFVIAAIVSGIVVNQIEHAGIKLFMLGLPIGCLMLAYVELEELSARISSAKRNRNLSINH